MRKPDERIVFSASETGLLVIAVAAGVGQGLLPKCIGDEHDKLVVYGTGALDMEATLHLHPDAVQLRRVQTVSRLIREAFASVFYGDSAGHI
ncbi:MAG: hypothetical protein AAGF94_10380 [Pseudomonadota bacterium]